MRESSVNIKCKLKLDGRWTFVPLARNGANYAGGAVVVHGKTIKPENPAYYIEWREGGKRLQKSVGPTWRHALDAQRSQQHVLALRASGADVPNTVHVAENAITIRDAINKYLDESIFAQRHKTRLKYRNALDEFLQYTQREHVESVTREDILGFLRDQIGVHGNSGSTARDKAVIVLAVMRQNGARIDMRRGDWPRKTERQPKGYSPDIIRRLLDAADQDEYELFQTFLGTGMRDAEVGYLSWDDFDAARRTVSVTGKPHLGWEPKTYQERTIPIVESLARLLTARRIRRPNDYLVFPTDKMGGRYDGGRRNRHMLDVVKRLALRAGVNCGRCHGTLGGKSVTCETHPVCRQIGLHRFRHTYATSLLRDGIDIMTLQHLLGHKDLDSTKQYLSAARESDIHLRLAGSTLSRAVDVHRISAIK